MNPLEATLTEGKKKFCFIGDMGVANDVQKKVAHLLKEEFCHSIHMLGDLIYPSGIKNLDDPELQKKFLRYYLPLTQIGNGPKLNLIMGNHDHRGSVEAWKEVSERERSINFPHPFYLQNWSGLCLVHLDSNYYKVIKDFLKGQQQKSWLNAQKDYMNQHCKIKIALTHHHYRSMGPHHFNATGSMKRFFESYIIGKFDYLISGHEHVLADEGKVKDTRLLISGAGGNYRGKEAGFLVLEVSVKDGLIGNITYSFRRISI